MHLPLMPFALAAGSKWPGLYATSDTGSTLFLRNGKIVACYGLGEGHADSVLGSQDDHRARFDRLAWRQLKIVSSEQNAQNHEDLQHRVVTADTAPRSASEWQIGEGRVAAFRSLW